MICQNMDLKIKVEYNNNLTNLKKKILIQLSTNDKNLKLIFQYNDKFIIF
jgi:hypothetical protein